MQRPKAPVSILSASKEGTGNGRLAKGRFGETVLELLSVPVSSVSEGLRFTATDEPDPALLSRPNGEQ